MAWTPVSDDSVTITIPVGALEGKCTIDRASIVYPSTLNQGQTGSFGCSYSNTGTGTDRFRIIFTLIDPDTGSVLTSVEKTTTTGIAVGSGQTVSANLTLPANYVKPTVHFGIDGGHEVGFYI